MDMRPSSPERPFGDVLRAYRVRAGLTQEELADLAHMSVHSISNYERGAPHLPRISAARLLADALNLTPDEQAAFLVATRRQAQRFPTVTALSADAPPYAIPLPLTPLIGREQELRWAGALLSSGDIRLLTIIGPPGVGKTRLALALARGGAAASYEVTALVSLAPLRDPTHVLGAIAGSLRLPEAPKRSLIETVSTFLQGKRTLLLLDNFEHLAASARVLAELLGQCPDLTVLATSRAPLRLRGEQLFHLAPLGLPLNTPHIPVDQVAEAPAVSLLLERVQALDPAFALSDANAPAIVAICRQLDGLPLALELAAARFPHLTPEALLGRLERRMDTLTSSAPDLPSHQQTLRATLEWSYALLPPAAQAAFRWLSVCVGGCTVEVAEAIYARTNLSAQTAATGKGSPLEQMALLLDHQLLVREIVADDHGSGEAVRLMMLATIQEYASELLQARSHEQVAAARVHAQTCVDLVEAAAPGFQGAEQARWMRRLRDEHDNIRAALRWSVEQREPLVALRLASALWVYWNTVGMLSEGRDWLEQALALAPAVETLNADGQRTLAEAYNGAGVLATRQGDFAAAERFLIQAMPLRRALGDPLAVASSLNSLGGLCMQQGRLSEAQNAWEESLAYRRQSGGGRAIALGLMNLGVLALNRGEIRAAIAYSEESAPLFRAAGDESMLATALINLSMASLLAGDLPSAERHVEEGLRIARQREQRRQIGHGLIVLSELARAAGELERAEALAREGLVAWREIGAQTDVAAMLAMLGSLHAERGELSAAETMLQESLTLSEQMADPFGLADVWMRLGHLARVRGDWEQTVAAYQRSLRVSVKMESTAGVPETLEGLAVALVEQGEKESAIQSFALAQSLRLRTGAARAPYNAAWVAPVLGALQAEAGTPRWEALSSMLAALSTSHLQTMVAEVMSP
ncbi:MAG TPA: tetratricopeptide repeat protein [Ktedonobacterales bacterium]|jgi:predicted ATPase/DNA-binding XRE family transcriptional regulator